MSGQPGKAHRLLKPFSPFTGQAQFPKQAHRWPQSRVRFVTWRIVPSDDLS
jgi:hypothetical protein